MQWKIVDDRKIFDGFISCSSSVELHEIAYGYAIMLLRCVKLSFCKDAREIPDSRFAFP